MKSRCFFIPLSVSLTAGRPAAEKKENRTQQVALAERRAHALHAANTWQNDLSPEQTATYTHDFCHLDNNVRQGIRSLISINLIRPCFDLSFYGGQSVQMVCNEFCTHKLVIMLLFHI